MSRAAPGERFALFGECLLVGVLVAATALPLVTLLSALAAGCAQIRAHTDGETTAVRAFFARVRAAYPGSAGWSLAAVGGFALLALDAAVVRHGLPGGGVVAVVCGLAATGLAVLALRAAAAWTPGAGWTGLVRRAGRRAALDDPSGSLLLVLALAVLVVVTWQLLPLMIPMTGCVMLAAVAVERRHAATREGARN